MRYCQLSSFEHIYIDEYKLSSNKSQQQSKKIKQSSLFCSIRILIALLSMLGTSIMYITRVNLNIAILAMVQTPTKNEFLTSINKNLTKFNNDVLVDHQSIIITDEGEFKWTPPEQGIILGSFFYGYLATQIIGGRLAESYLQPDKLIFIALSSSGIINLLTPILARNSWLLFILSRILLGAFQGVLYPAFYCLFSRWIPQNERSTFIPWLDAGSIMGTILISATSGKMILYFSNFGGWPVVFYFSGALALLWSLVWIGFVRSNPEDHPLITKEELQLLSQNNNNKQNQYNNIKPQWSSILTSTIFYGVLITKICYGIVFDFVSQKIPAYLSTVLQLPMDETGLSFSLIMFGYMLTLLSCGMIADYIISKNSNSNTGIIRKLFQFISAIIMIVALLLLIINNNVNLNKWFNVILLALLMFGYGFTSGGDLPAVVDISGPLSGTVFALMNTLCSISGFMVPYAVGLVIESAPSSIQSWRNLFISCTIIMTIGIVSFLLFSSSKLQTNWFQYNNDERFNIIDDDNAIKIPILQFEYKNSLSLSLLPPVNKFNSSNIPKYDTFYIGGSIDNRKQQKYLQQQQQQQQHHQQHQQHQQQQFIL